jgi:uncharacterized ferritin-like protein (DUF455 family)
LEVRELAEKALFSASLADKLATPESLTDDAPGAALDAPEGPARPSGLGFAMREDRVAFPGPSSIRDERTIGEALHYFANHELLAVELMALCLLKFPDAPKTFRRAIARTLIEEQEHVRLYHARMQSCGVEFGEIPVGDYFWRVTAPMTDPSQFVARMSLTFEQANLDYSGFYGEVFRRVGDDETAALMQRVYEDEIRHVRLGLHWFNRWRNPGESLFASYAAALDRPLSPTRARGIGFNRQGREAAGLPGDFIDQLAVFGHSRGRSPDVYRFDPLAEEHCRTGGARSSKSVMAMAADLSTLPAFLASADDVVVVPVVPSTALRSKWAEAGLPVPEFVAGMQPDALAGLADRKVRNYRPWAWSPAEDAWAESLGKEPGERSEVFAKVASKAFDLALRDLVDCSVPDFHAGRVLRQPEELAKVLGEFADSGIDRAIVKPAYGAAGRDNLVVSTTGNDASLHGKGPWVAEPWYDFMVTGSTQLEVETERVRVLGDTVMLTRGDGNYAGTITGDLAAAMPEAAKRVAFGDGAGMQLVHEVARMVGVQLRKAGYLGPAGIDWGILRTSRDEMHMHPLIEVNPRFTVGRVALALRKRTLSSRTGVLALVSAARLEALLTNGMVVENRTGKALMAGGVLPLTDAETARRLGAVWVVAESPGGCRAVVAQTPSSANA